MSSLFQLEHANIMAFMTSRSHGVPRIRKRDLLGFLNALEYDAKRWLLTERNFDPCLQRIAIIAAQANLRLNEIRHSIEKEIISSIIVERVLENLRSEFSCFQLFALAVGHGEHLRDAAHRLTMTNMYGKLLVIIPEYGTTKQNFEVIDPIPTLSTAIHAAPDWPGILFWTANGASAFTPLAEVDELLQKLKFASRADAMLGPFYMRSMPGFDGVLRKWAKKKPSRYRRLLHLSDLHFGATCTAENQPLLEDELYYTVKSVDKVVITGDLFDTPNKKYTSHFSIFKDIITNLASGSEPIIIIGDYDQKMISFFEDEYKQFGLIESTKIIVDDACQMIFICLNSSIEGNFPRGKITSLQLDQVDEEYHTITVARPELKNYLPIILVHHHPFSFNFTPETWVQRTMNSVGVRNEASLEIIDAEDLHRFCRDWKVKTILHGHKHKARYVEQNVAMNGKNMSLTAIGCGSSLGTEGSPISYNILEWNPQNQERVVSFFESINGGEFREIAISVSPEHLNRV